MKKKKLEMQKYLILVTNFKLYISQHRCKTCSQWHTFRITLEKQHAHGKKKIYLQQSDDLKRQQLASQTSGRGTKRPATTSGVLRGLSLPLSLFGLVQQHGLSYSQESCIPRAEEEDTDDVMFHTLSDSSLLLLLFLGGRGKKQLKAQNLAAARFEKK